MKWRSPEKRHADKVERWKHWNRSFAWWPINDNRGSTYWMEFVWWKKHSRDKDDNYPWILEVRPGNAEAPAIADQNQIQGVTLPELRPSKPTGLL